MIEVGMVHDGGGCEACMQRHSRDGGGGRLCWVGSALFTTAPTMPPRPPLQVGGEVTAGGPSSSCQLEGCRLSDNEGAGVHVRDGGSAKLTRCVCGGVCGGAEWAHAHTPLVG